MKEECGNLFSADVQPSAIAITTNGFVKRNGRCVMGRGCAKQARDRYPGLDMLLGTALRKYGNVPCILIAGRPSIVSFPVKPAVAIFDGHNAVRHMSSHFIIGDRVPGWACLADLGLICSSARALVQLADLHHWSRVRIPRPGCGAGELTWDVVAPKLHGILDDRFIAMTFERR